MNAAGCFVPPSMRSPLRSLGVQERSFIRDQLCAILPCCRFEKELLESKTMLLPWTTMSTLSSGGALRGEFVVDAFRWLLYAPALDVRWRHLGRPTRSCHILSFLNLKAMVVPLGQSRTVPIQAFTKCFNLRWLHSIPYHHGP